jgi:hypothetical protein
MSIFIDKPNPILSPTSADFAIAAAQLCFLTSGDADPIQISRLTSSYAGRPILVVNLEHLPQRPGLDENGYRLNGLSDEQIRDHVKRLHVIERETFFNNGSGFPIDWDWAGSGQLHEVSSYSLCTNDPRDELLPSRMSGDYWVKAALLTTAERNSNNPSVYEPFCKRNVRDAYRFGHELAHAFQLCPTRFLPNAAWRWETEIDADKGSFAGLSLLANRQHLSGHKVEFEETIKTVIHERSLDAFIAAYPVYFTALRLNGHDNVTYEQAVACNRELRFRVYAEIEGIELPSSSEQIQALITRWEKREKTDEPLVAAIQKAFGDPWDWGSTASRLGDWSKYNYDLNRSIPTLYDILHDGLITDPLSRRNAELVIGAAIYLHPHLQPLLKTKPNTVHRQSQQIHAFA